MFTRIAQRNETLADRASVDRLASATGLSPLAAEVLIGRGVDTPEKVEAFLSPSVDQLNDPFLLRGMKELTERLHEAIEEQQTVVVYGDYDVDGICATAILTGYLTQKGVKATPYIPSRKTDGYGITLETLERLLDERFPDLILTCDCGISAHDEIAAIADSYVDVIVTDHHEIPKVVPDCVIVNPKMPGQEYPFTQLCGAGVAFKVVQAMEGTAYAMRYIDLTAIATIADLVPLVEENRAIVKLGLDAINQGHLVKGFKSLLDTAGTVTATDIAYRLAPKINAAGRLGDAYRAYDLIFKDDEQEICALADSINADNVRRKELCANVFAQAKELVRSIDLSKTFAIVLMHPDWEKGLTSIVAAQIASEYKRPTFLCVRNGDTLKGTARSVDGINLYEVLSAAEDLLTEFGGHSQAAGFSIEEDKLGAFAQRINEFLTSHYDAEYFLPKGDYDREARLEELTFGAAREIERLEPFGNGNARPVFRIALDRATVEPMKNKPQHLLLKKDKSSVSAFGVQRYAGILRYAEGLCVNVDFGINTFNGRDYLSMVMKDFDFRKLSIPTALTRTVDASAYLALTRAHDLHETQRISADEVDAMLTDGRRHGTLLVAYTVRAYERACVRFATDGLWHSFATRETGSNYNRIVLAPTPDFDAFGYDRIILLEGGIDPRMLSFPIDSGAQVYSLSDASPVLLSRVSSDRRTFVSCYASLLTGGHGVNLIECLASVGADREAQLAACYAVFASLGIASYDGVIRMDNSQKKDLSSSVGYRLLGGCHAD